VCESVCKSVGMHLLPVLIFISCGVTVERDSRHRSCHSLSAFPVVFICLPARSQYASTNTHMHARTHTPIHLIYHQVRLHGDVICSSKTDNLTTGEYKMCWITKLLLRLYRHNLVAFVGLQETECFVV